MHIQVAFITDYFTLKKILNEKQYLSSNFYTQYNISLLYSILTRNCYIIRYKDQLQGFLCLKNYRYGQVLFIPSPQCRLSFFRLIYILKNVLKLEGYTLSLHYDTLKFKQAKSLFSFKIINDYKSMSVDISDFKDANDVSEKSSVVLFKKNKDESIRANLQNQIFGDTPGRVPITEDEILNEEKSSSYIENMCYILTVDNNPCGYGQISYMHNRFNLVNFGIVPSMRGKGYGKYFLSHILQRCKDAKINNLFLEVDNANTSAINLYKSFGFKHIDNYINIYI